jgi:putative ubiquitin-RnfH superfamily antitoxin RatB of RatAB toxin-antitoxin module
MPYVYFRVSEQAKWGVDENGNYVSVYSKIKVNRPVDTAEKVEVLRELLADVMHIKKEYITVIDREEYMRNVNDDEDLEDEECDE